MMLRYKGKIFRLYHAAAHTSCLLLAIVIWGSECDSYSFHFASIYLSKGHHAFWSGIGTFSIREGCQWVCEPVSRHFFINQTSD